MLSATAIAEAPLTVQALVEARKGDTRGLVGLLVMHVPTGGRFVIGSVRVTDAGTAYLREGPPTCPFPNSVPARECVLIDLWPTHSPRTHRLKALGLEKPRRFQRSPRGSGVRVWCS